MQQHNFQPGRINKCQICGSKKLVDVINLGEQPLANTLLLNIKNKMRILIKNNNFI